LIFNNKKEENFETRIKPKKKKMKFNDFFKSLKDDDKNEQISGIIAIFFGLISLSILLYVYFKYPSEQIIGEGFINEELQFLYTPFYRFQFKPITLLLITVLLFWMFGLESKFTYLSKIPVLFKKILFIFFCLVAFVYTFENIQNFFNWYSFFIINTGKIPIDKLISQIKPDMPKPLNYTFVSKINTIFWSGALYGIYFTHKLLKAKED